MYVSYLNRAKGTLCRTTNRYKSSWTKRPREKEVNVHTVRVLHHARRSPGCLRRYERRVPGESDERRVFDPWGHHGEESAGPSRTGLRGVQPLCYDIAINISEWRPPTSLYASWNRRCAFRRNTKGDLVAALLSRAFPGRIFASLAHENREKIGREASVESSFRSGWE